MSISYKPLLLQLVDKGMSKSDLLQMGFSSATIAKLSKNEYVALSVLDKLCQKLNCNIEDVLSVVADEPGND